MTQPMFSSIAKLYRHSRCRPPSLCKSPTCPCIMVCGRLKKSEPPQNVILGFLAAGETVSVSLTSNLHSKAHLLIDTQRLFWGGGVKQVPYTSSPFDLFFMFSEGYHHTPQPWVIIGHCLHYPVMQDTPSVLAQTCVHVTQWLENFLRKQ